jgi:hypothetical protein
MTVIPNFHMRAFKSDEDRAAAAARPLDERMSMITNLLVPHRKFDAAQDAMANWFVPDPPGWIAGLIGNSRAGKSYAAKYFASKHPAELKEHGYDYPVAYVEARSDWTAIEFSRQIYLATGATAIPRETNATVNTKAAGRLADFGVRLLVIDDAHFLWEGRSAVSNRLEGMLIHIANQKCNVLLVGLDSVSLAVQKNDQLFRRGSFPHYPLVEYDNKDFDEKNRFFVFLNEVDLRLPFKHPSNLGRHHGEALLDISGGSVGLVMNIVQDAAYMAARAEAPCIKREHLRQAVVSRSALGTKVPDFNGPPEAA